MSLGTRGAMRVLAVLLTVGIAAGCSGEQSPSPTPSASTPATPSPTASLAAPTPTASTVASCANQTLAGMSEAQRIGQLFNVGLANDRLDTASRQAIVANHFGSVWYRARTTIGVAGVRKVADAIQALATEDATARVGFFVAANQEGGLIQGLAVARGLAQRGPQGSGPVRASARSHPRSPRGSSNQRTSGPRRPRGADSYSPRA